MSKTNLRPAIAMIELIFALVVMAIALLSAPMLIHTATQSGFVAVQQEAINEAATRVSMVMGYHWDENDANESYLDPILYVSNGNTGLGEYNSTGRRIGTPLVSQRSFIREDGMTFNASTTLSMDPNDANITDDIDDFNGMSFLISVESARVNYVEKTTIDINTSVSYTADTPSGGTYVNPGVAEDLTFSPNLSAVATPTTNIKKILVTLTSTSSSSELNTKKIVLKAFSCNIGAYDLKEREF